MLPQYYWLGTTSYVPKAYVGLRIAATAAVAIVQNTLLTSLGFDYKMWKFSIIGVSVIKIWRAVRRHGIMCFYDDPLKFIYVQSQLHTARAASKSAFTTVFLMAVRSSIKVV
jgi:hypothetical protein